MKKITVLLLGVMLMGLMGCSSNEHSEQKKESAKKGIMGDPKRSIDAPTGL